MDQLEAIRNKLPEAAKDLRINLTNVLASEHLTADQVWGTAISSAFFLRCDELIHATLTDAAIKVSETVIDDARAAASLMGMNTIFYRFRHMIGKESYVQRPARLRVQRMLSPATNKPDFELFSLACAAIAGCEACVKAHEDAVLHGGLREEHVHDAVRIAAVFQGVAIALAIPAPVSG